MTVQTNTTPNNGFRYPTSDNDGLDFATGVADTAGDIDAMWREGTLAARPAAGIPHRRYYATDQQAVYLDSGTSWTDLATLDGNGYIPLSELGNNQGAVTSLPGSPTDGQTIDFVADATNGVIWTFRYRAASGSQFKWEFVGGPPLEIGGQAYVDPTEPRGSWFPNEITLPGLPNGGDFDIEFGARITISSGTSGTDWFVDFGVVKLGSLTSFTSSTSYPPATESLSASARFTAVPGGTTLQLETITNCSPGQAQFAPYWLSAKPVRVG